MNHLSNNRARRVVTIHNQRWFYRLVKQNNKQTGCLSSHSLLDEYTISQLASRLVVCFTPNQINGQPARTKAGEPLRLYSLFDSYLEYFQYAKRFPKSERCFYEIIMGEFAQKPHFDVDLSAATFKERYPEQDLTQALEQLKTALIKACQIVLATLGITLNLAKDVLLYSSHGEEKYSYHLVINHYCHGDNQEAKAFYEAVISQVRILTNDQYWEFIDHMVYSPRQQFRMVGCHKSGSQRDKIFWENFTFEGRTITHQYDDDFLQEEIDPDQDISSKTELNTNDRSLELKRLAIIRDSLVSFVADCTYIPSLLPTISKPSYASSADLPDDLVEKCLQMLKDKLPANQAPFSVKNVKGCLILLKRERASDCPICQRVHEHEHPYLIVHHHRVMWDCRRHTNLVQNFLVGYLTNEPALSEDFGQTTGTYQNGEEFTGEEFAFGIYEMSPANSSPTDSSPSVQATNRVIGKPFSPDFNAQSNSKPMSNPKPSQLAPTDYALPPMLTDVLTATRQITQQKTIKVEQKANHTANLLAIRESLPLNLRPQAQTEANLRFGCEIAMAPVPTLSR